MILHLQYLIELKTNWRVFAMNDLSSPSNSFSIFLLPVAVGGANSSTASRYSLNSGMVSQLVDILVRSRNATCESAPGHLWSGSQSHRPLDCGPVAIPCQGRVVQQTHLERRNSYIGIHKLLISAKGIASLRSDPLGPSNCTEQSEYLVYM